MNLDQIIVELCRLAETKNWNGKATDEALSAAVEGMEYLWEQKQADRRKHAVIQALKKPPRIWC
jgi:hypothetical protein